MSAAARLGMPVAAMAGIGFAFESGARRSARASRPSITGTAVALVILVGSLTFGASLSNLVTHPALYGWTWDREVLAGSGYGDIPLPLANRLLGGDPAGIAVGRFLWDRFAAELYVVPEPAIAAAMTAIVGVATLIMAILAALVPGWLAARTRVAQSLRAE